MSGPGRGERPPGSECCVVGGDDHGEAYTAIVQGGRLSRESSNIAEAEAFSVAEGNMCGTVMRGTLCRGRRPHHAQRDHVGTWEIPRSASGGKPPWSASGRRGAEADDARTWEVRLRHSSGEADEQGRATGCGAGGAK